MVGGARNYVHRVGSAAHQASYGILQCAPDTAVELVLQLRSLVRGVVGLVVHGTVALAAAVRTLVPAGITGSAVVHGAVAVADDVHLQVFVDVGIIVPAARRGAAALVRSAERIRDPQRRIPAVAVIVAVVAVRANVAAAAVEPAKIVFSAGDGRKFQPARSCRGAARARSGERTDGAITILV